MDNRLIACLVLGCAALLATLVLIWKRRCRETGLLCIRETWMTAVLGLMLLALGFAFPILKTMDPTAAGTDARSYWFVAAFGLACYCLGDYALLFTFVKCTVLHEDRAVAYSTLGAQQTLYWADVVRVEKPVTRSCYILTDQDGNSIQVGGDSKASRQFMEFAREKVKGASGTELLRQVEHRLGGKHL